MAETTTTETTKVTDLITKLESQAETLTKFTTLYKTLTTHFTALNTTLTTQLQTLDTKLQSLSTNDQTTLTCPSPSPSPSLSLPCLSSLVASQRETALSEFSRPPPSDHAPLSESLTWACRRMDPTGLLKIVVARRREAGSMRGEMVNSLKECVDPPRLVLETVREFVELKAAGKGGLTDKRWACSVIISGLFPPEGPRKAVFSRKTVELAECVAREWREKAEKVAVEKGGGDGEGRFGMGPGEAAIWLQIVIGFGLERRFEEEYYRKLVIEFSGRRDMPKLAVCLFGDRIADIIDELVKIGKLVEAVHFAVDCGLTERFQPVPLLESSLINSKKNVTDILTKGSHSSAAQDEANIYEVNAIRSILKCVEDHNLESDFPTESLKERLAALEKTKAEKKKYSPAVSKPSNKRPHSSGTARGPSKFSKSSGPYPSFGQRNPVLQSPVLRYIGPYSYPGQSPYDAVPTSTSYRPRFDGPNIPGDSLFGARGRLVGGSYGGQYGAYPPPPARQSASYVERR